MAKRAISPKSGKKKSDMTVTMIMVLVLAVIIGAFFFFNKSQDKTPVVKKSVVQIKVEKVVPTPVVVNKPVVPPVVLPVKPKPVVEQKIVAEGSAGKIAFVLDDWGNSMRNCKYLKQIDAPLAIAILPRLPHSNDIAKCASLYDKTIMLHLPLQAYHNNDPYPTDYIIKTDMKPAKVEKLVNAILDKMPYIEGVNNHMGSRATEDKNLMTLILRRLKKKNLFFVDSMTAPNHSVCNEIAKDLNLSFARRDVFLDNINTREEILNQMQSLMNKAKTKGYAIAIGHDRELTMKIIAEQIPLLRKQGFAIVSVKDLLKSQK